MPRKGKRSESQKQRRKQPASCGGTNSVSGRIDANQYVLSVAASHCQSDSRYKIYSRGRQCTCNALTFLAVHNERNELLGFDLDRILQKGDAVYTSVKQTLRSTGQFVDNFFNFDELPSTIKTTSACYNILKHPQRVGFLKDSPALGEYENLENTLQCLRADVSDALLLCGCTCIAVFRDRSGRFGYFDPHCRTVYGMPDEDESTGTAVMLTFFRLEDMIERLLLLFQWCFDLRDQQQFDLLPISFINQITESSVRPEVSLNCCEFERDVQPSTSFENKALSNNEQCRSADVSQQCVQDPVQQPSDVNGATSTNDQALTCQDKMDVLTTVTQNQDRCKNVSFSEPSHGMMSQDRLPLSAPNHQYSQSTTKQAEKLNKTRKRKAYCKKWQKEMVQRQDVYDKKQAVRKVYDYKTSSKYRQRHNQAMKNKYWNSMFYREQHKEALKNKYKNINEYRERKKTYGISNYRNDDQYRGRKKSDAVSNYRNNEQYRGRKKE